MRERIPVYVHLRRTKDLMDREYARELDVPRSPARRTPCRPSRLRAGTARNAPQRARARPIRACREALRPAQDARAAERGHERPGALLELDLKVDEGPE